MSKLLILLIERVAYEVAEQLQQRFGTSWLRLKLTNLKRLLKQIM